MFISHVSSYRCVGVLLLLVVSLLASVFPSAVASAASSKKVEIFAVTKYGANLKDSLPDDDALDACLKDAIAAGGICSIPKGKLILSIYPPALRQSVGSLPVKDLGGAT